jgi:hypothetical protein
MEGKPTSRENVEKESVMAEEAVISELVSARLFPVTRENTGKFAIFSFEIARAPRLSEENSVA